MKAVLPNPNSKNHETATFLFVPWVVGFLSGDLARGNGKALPVNDPQAITQWVLEALRDILPKFTWRALIFSGGWERLSVPSPTNPEKPLDVRLWESPGVAPLTYTGASIELLLRCYNLYQKESLQEAALALRQIPKIDGLMPSGDLFFQHQVFLRLRPDLVDAGLGWYDGFAPNPLTRLAFPGHFPAAEEGFLARLLEPDLLPFLPWLGRELPRSWAEAEVQRWEGPIEQFLTFSHGQGETLSAWFRLLTARGRTDLLVPFLRYFVALMEGTAAHGWAPRLAQRTEGMRLADRQVLAEAWISTLGLASRLRAEYRRARAVHPIEREAPDRIFLASYAELEFDAAADYWEQVVAELRPQVA